MQAAPVAPTGGAEEAPQANPLGTVLALFGIALSGATITGQLPSAAARHVAIGVGISLACSALLDLRAGVRNLIRADLMAILAFYFLTLFEFLFPQPNFDTMLGLRITREALISVLVGLAGLLIGRHLIKAKRQPFEQTFTREIPPAWLIVIFWACVGIGFLHMLVAVHFDVPLMIEYFMEPRFSQPWQRGKFGDWRALLVELGLFIYLIPPLAGIAIARRHRYPRIQLVLMGAVLVLTFFYGFSSGTRNIFASYLVTFLIGYAFALPAGRRKELLLLCGTCTAVMLAATVLMLKFRSVGLRNYLSGSYEPVESQEQTLFVDYNLYAIARLMEVFPRHNQYLGLEVPYLALIRPIPRAIWAGKPEGLSKSIEDALGVEGLTIAASFVGEAYMAGGRAVVFLVGLFFGALTGWWSYLASSRNSELGILIYASGFFAAVISMRSLFVFTTALLPTVAALVIGAFIVRKLAAQAKRWMNRTGSGRHRMAPRGASRRQS